MSSWLMKFGFGGVQEFIAQSRKTRDLAAGSLLLQETAKAVAQKAQTMGAEVILPQEAEVACPHQLLLRWKDVDRQAIQEKGKSLQDTAKTYWQDAVSTQANEALKELEGLKSALIDLVPVIDQLGQAFETYWVAIPEEKDYPAIFHEIQECYELRRFTRTFPQEQKLGNPLGTCAQCGARNAVVNPFKKSFHHPKLDSRDKICAVCLAKRLWSYESPDLGEAYPSTVHLARDRFFRLPEYADRLELLKQHRAETMDWKEFQAGTKDSLPKVTGAIEAAMKARDSLPPYYAALYFDGDHMGEWFSGKHFTEPQSLEAGQRKLSQALAGFVTTLRAGSKCLRATVIYLGGDDGLVLLPVDFLFPFIRLVRDSWLTHVEKAPAICRIAEGQEEEKRGPTLSLHASVVHQSAPFQRVIAGLHPAMKETKEQGNRDAFSVAVAPRSGSEGKALFRWQDLDSFIRTVEAFTTWRLDDFPPKGIGAVPSDSELKRRRQKTFPSRLPYALIEAMEPFFGEGGALSTTALETAFDLELARLLGKREEGDKTADPLSRFLDGIVKGERLGTLVPRERLVSVLTILPSMGRWLDWGSGEVKS